MVAPAFERAPKLCSIRMALLGVPFSPFRPALAVRHKNDSGTGKSSTGAPFHLRIWSISFVSFRSLLQCFFRFFTGEEYGFAEFVGHAR